MSRGPIRLRVVALIALGASALSGCSAGEETITLTQRVDDPVELVFLDLNPDGDSGDITTFEAGVYLDDEPYGSVMGTITTVGSVGEGAQLDREERLLTAVYDLPGGQISALGISYYFGEDILLPAGEPMTRAIVGGTGEYVGVDGEVTTTRNPDDSYTHVLRIVK